MVKSNVLTVIITKYSTNCDYYYFLNLVYVFHLCNKTNAIIINLIGKKLMYVSFLPGKQCGDATAVWVDK